MPKRKIITINGKECYRVRYGGKEYAYTQKVVDGAYAKCIPCPGTKRCWTVVPGTKLDKKGYPIMSFRNLLKPGASPKKMSIPTFIKMHEEGGMKDGHQGNHTDDCENKPVCANPDCLYAGTQQENVDDMYVQGSKEPAFYIGEFVTHYWVTDKYVTYERTYL